MVKTAGLSDGLYVNGYDLSGDVTAVDKMTATVGEQNATGLDKLARERLQLLADGSVAFTSLHTGDTSDSGAVHAHKRLRALSNTKLVTYFNGATADGLAVGLDGDQFNYELTRGDKGDLFAKCVAKSARGVGLEVGRILDRAAAPSAVGNGTVLDLGASHGWTAAAFHLHVTSFTGTSVTLIIQTDDNSGMTTPTTYGTFTAVAGRTYQRLAVATAPERYIRWRADSGTFSAVAFAVAAFPTS